MLTSQYNNVILNYNIFSEIITFELFYTYLNKNNHENQQTTKQKLSWNKHKKTHTHTHTLIEYLVRSRLNKKRRDHFVSENEPKPR